MPSEPSNSLQGHCAHAQEMTLLLFFCHLHLGQFSWITDPTLGNDSVQTLGSYPLDI